MDEIKSPFRRRDGFSCKGRDCGTAIMAFAWCRVSCCGARYIGRTGNRTRVNYGVVAVETGGKQVPCCGARHLPAVTKHLGICRPLPLAQVVYSATGSTPLAPHRTVAFDWFESVPLYMQKADTRMGICFWGIYYTI